MTKEPKTITMVDEPFELRPNKNVSDMTPDERREWEQEVGRLLGHRVAIQPAPKS